MSSAMWFHGALYEMLLKYHADSIEISSLISKIMYIITAIGCILILPCRLYRIRKLHNKKCTGVLKPTIEASKYKYECLSPNRYQSIINHKRMLSKLEYAANKCNENAYALECIDIATYCPHLINIKSPISGLTPFHRICFHGHTCLISFMLAKGADPFVVTATGENALCIAIGHFFKNPTKTDFSCLDILQKTGCNLGLNNEWFNIFFKLALVTSHTKLAEWLIVHFQPSSHNNNCKRGSSAPPTSVYNKIN